MMKELDRALNFAGRGQYELALLLFDIDKFKLINDVYGHQAGDVVLKTVAARMNAVIRKIDMVARLGGDEFIIILSMIKDKNDILSLIQRMFKALDEPIPVNDTSVNIHISVGVSVYPEDASDKEGLIKHADSSMYEAKKQQGSSYCF
jgi:diguanylate cyclase (GGDEF)-like protein